MDTGGLVIVVTLQASQGLRRADVGHAATRQITFLDSRLRRVECILYAVFLLFHLHLGGSAYVQDSHATGELAQTLLELLAIVIGSGDFNLFLDSRYAVFDLGCLSGTAYDGGILLGDGHLLGLTEHVGRCVLQGVAALLGDHGCTGKDGDILQHFLAAVTEARSLDGSDLQGATKFVHHQGGQRLAVHIFRDDEQALAFTGNRLQDRHQILHRGDFLIGHEDERIVQQGLHLLAIGHEVRADVAAVELHTFDHFHLGLGTLGFLNGDNAVLLHLRHSIGDEFTNECIVVGRNDTHLLHLGVVVAHVLALLLQVLHDGGHGLVNTAFEVHRVGTCGHVLDTDIDDGLGQHRSGGGTVTGLVVGLGSDLLDHLGAHVGEAVFQLHCLGYGYTVLGHLRSTEFLVNHHVAAFRTQRYLDGVCQRIRAFFHTGTNIHVEFYLFCHNAFLLMIYRIARMSDCLTIRYFLSSTVTSVPAYLP